jgi:hypothetical protein
MGQGQTQRHHGGNYSSTSVTGPLLKLLISPQFDPLPLLPLDLHASEHVAEHVYSDAARALAKVLDGLNHEKAQLLLGMPERRTTTFGNTFA